MVPHEPVHVGRMRAPRSTTFVSRLNLAGGASRSNPVRGGNALAALVILSLGANVLGVKGTLLISTQVA